MAALNQDQTNSNPAARFPNARDINTQSSLTKPKSYFAWLPTSPRVIGLVILYSTVMTGLFIWLMITRATTKPQQLTNDASQQLASESKHLDQAITLEGDWITSNMTISPDSLWPLPNHIQAPESFKSVTIKSPIAVQLMDEASASSDTLQKTVHRQLKYIFPCTDMDEIKIIKKPSARSHSSKTTTIAINLRSTNETLSVNTNERYVLNITTTPSSTEFPYIHIDAATVYGAMRALDTLSQLVVQSNPDSCTCSYTLVSGPLVIDDWPRLPHRGLLIDTARHFMPFQTLRRLVNGMSSAKLNVLHWHVSDAQSFPMRFKDVPELADRGAYSPSRVYDEPDVIEFIEYCRLRGIRVIPEFDIPGHVYSFSHAYPDIVVCPNQHPYPTYGASPPTGQLDPTNPNTFQVLQRLFTAINRVFPDQYVHLGHDEINKNCWSQFDNGNTTLTLQKFHAELQPILQKINPKKNWIVWEEPFTTLNLETSPTPSNSSLFQTVQLWVDDKQIPNVQSANKQVIMSVYKFWYLDCGEGAWLTGAKISDNGWCVYNSWINMYSYNPFGTTDVPPASLDKDSNEIDANSVLGGEVAMWTEQTDQFNLMTKVFPRTLAFAERLWSTSSTLSNLTWTSIVHRLHLARVQLLLQREVPSGPVQPHWCIGNERECSSRGDIII